MQNFNLILYNFLNRLDSIADENPEINDTAVREEIAKLSSRPGVEKQSSPLD